MIDTEAINSMRTKWTRQQTKMANMLQSLEKELDSLKKKNIHESIIDNKEKQIEQTIDSLNAADDLIQLLVFYLKTANLEMEIMEKQMTKWLREGDKRKEFFSESNTMDMAVDMIREFKRQRGV
jgi:hypothetical protein